MLTVRRATDVRKNFSQFIDGVIYERPALVQRNRDLLVALSFDHLEEILRLYRFIMEYKQEDDGSYSGSLEGFDLVANALSITALRYQLAQELIKYAEQYEADFPLYFRTPNRTSHFPYVYHVLIQSNLENVAGLIDAKPERT